MVFLDNYAEDQRGKQSVRLNKKVSSFNAFAAQDKEGLHRVNPSEIDIRN